MLNNFLHKSYVFHVLCLQSNGGWKALWQRKGGGEKFQDWGGEGGLQNFLGLGVFLLGGQYPNAYHDSNKKEQMFLYSELVFVD